MSIRSPVLFAVVLVSAFLLLCPVAARAQQTLEVQADADTLIRTDLDVRRNDNYGCHVNLIVGTSRGGGGIPEGGADAMRSLIHFDLSGVASQLVPDLKTAELELVVFWFDNGNDDSVYTVDVHRVLAPWVEGDGFEGPYYAPDGTYVLIPTGCTTTDDADGVAWVGPPEGDANNQTQPPFDPPVIASTTIPQAGTAWGAQGDRFQWDITALVRNWFQGTSNYGILLRDITSQDGVFRGVTFAARDGKLRNIPDPRVGDGPKLILTFAPLTVQIDIKPGSEINSINLGSAGVVPVAILSSPTFDATQVNPETVTLAGASVKMAGKSGKYLCHSEYVNGDNLLDLVCQVMIAQFLIEEGQSVAVLEAKTFHGRSIRGEDTIRIVP